MSRPANRKSAIITQLSDLSRNGWANATPYDYEPLERELNRLTWADLTPAQRQAHRTANSPLYQARQR